MNIIKSTLATIVSIALFALAVGCVNESSMTSESSCASMAQLTSDCSSPIDGARLKKRRTIAIDGSVDVHPGWVDSETNAACTFRLAADGENRCLPANVQHAGYFYDSACSQRAVYMYEPLCGDPDFASWIDTPGAECFSGGEHIARVTGRATPEMVYYKDPAGACVATDVNTGFVVLTLGDEIQASDFVSGVDE